MYFFVIYYLLYIFLLYIILLYFILLYFCSFEIPVTIPGDSLLTIKVMDWDGIGDDLVVSLSFSSSRIN